jgi:FkbM family methyltransferase
MRKMIIRGLIRRSFQLAWSLTGGTTWGWNPPYEYVFEIASEKVHDYIGVPKSHILKWCIVGGYLGLEVPRLLGKYRNVSIDLFECSYRYLPALRKKFGTSHRVNVIGSAVAAEVGSAVFHETTLTGTGSILELGDLAQELFSAEAAESFDVQVTTLDAHYDSETIIDVLQIDVQGAELLVLKGAESVLARTKAVFVEVSTRPALYTGSTTMNELVSFLNERGFFLQLLGNDTNGTGNALFVKKG